MTCSIDRFGPEPDRGLVFSKHSSGHFNKSSILSLDHTIFLRCISRREFMSKAIFIKKFFDMSILNSVPLSLLICLRDNSYSVCALFAKVLKISTTLLLSSRNKTQVYREKSSTMTRSYLLP